MLHTSGTGTIENVVAGPASQVADHMEHWYRNKACDGFNIAPPHALARIRKVRAYLVSDLIAVANTGGACGRMLIRPTGDRSVWQRVRTFETEGRV